ncbi:hypothetical protein O181_091493, partial [Austropuccinia psidii MF-1]|nr:hypothetical protein [Austropuccinia psidii MF-1]
FAMLLPSARKGLSALLERYPSDVVLITALRTPVARSFRGSFKDAYPEELLANILSVTQRKLKDFGVEETTVNDIAVGNVLMELGGAKSGRLAALHAG